MAEIFDISDHRRRDDYRVIVSPGLWKGYEVTIEPPTSTHPLRSFKTLPRAIEHAEAVRRAEGWPVSVLGDDDGGQAA